MTSPAPGDLAEFIQRTMDRNLEAVKTADPAELSKPPRIELPEGLLEFLRNRERWLGFSVMHLSYHLGQINMIHRILHPEAKGF